MRVKLMFVWLMVMALGFVVSCSKDETGPEAEIKLNPSNFNISVKELTYNSAEIQWTASLISDKSKIVYDVYLNDELKAKNLENLSYRFEELEAVTTYNLEVIAKSTYDTQVIVSYDITTKDTPSPGAIALKMDELSTDQIKVSWANSDPTQTLSYAIYLDDVLKAENLTVSTFTFSELEGNKLYHIKLVGKNEFNKTVESKLDLTTNDYADPSDFTLSVESVTGNGAKIVWGSSESENLTYRVLLNTVEHAKDLKVLEFEFKSLTYNTQYIATVVATNEHGKTKSKQIEFTTLEAGGPADFKIFVDNISQESALIRWETTGDKAEVIGYKVFVNGFFKGEAFSDNQLLVDRLEAGKVYKLKIEARNAYNKTLEKTTEFSTLEPASLSDFTVSAQDVEQTSALLTWTECVASDGSKVTYDVYYENGLIAKRGLEERQYQASELRAGKEYTYKIEARSEKVLLPRTHTISFTTKAYEVPGEFELKVQDITTSQAKVIWTNSELPSGGEITYEAYLNDIAYTYNASGNAFVFKNLKAETNYTARIVAKSQNNTTNEQTIGFTTKAEAIPEVQLSVANVGIRSFELNWMLTESPSYDSYELFLDGKSIKAGYFLTYTFSDMQSNTSYKLKVLGKRAGKTYQKEIEVKTLAYPEALDFDMVIHPKSYNQLEVDLNDFHEKNRDRFDDFSDMTFEAYLNEVKKAWGKDVTSKIVTNLEELTHYNFQLIIKYADGTIALEKNTDFTTPANKAPVWTKDLKIKQTGFSFLELENNFATDSDDSNLVYTYYVNGTPLQMNINYGGNTRGTGQIESGVNTNDNSILLTHLESNKEYSFYIEARDPLGKIGRSNTIQFRTSVDAKETFDIMAAIETNVKRVGPRWAKMGEVSSMEEIRINWTIDGVKMERGQYIDPSKIVELGGDHSLVLDYSPFLKENPDASLSFTVLIKWIKKEALEQSESIQIVIQE
ncbi:fibronectin type III domain-containing protein [Marinifilum fragile]|uniref:fibronectin type III domain-containing protein n=1 Tax=Marinifilum fragile TaxID=570161 RepID=UPI0006D1104D|nr:fibronectin type III domain-containing protein [Marinifilum fragile]